MVIHISKWLECICCEYPDDRFFIVSCFDVTILWYMVVILHRNGEGNSFDPAFKTNFLKTESLTFIKALGIVFHFRIIITYLIWTIVYSYIGDNMIDPKESEWYGTYEGDFNTIIPLSQSPWFLNDTFWLQTLSNQGRLSYNTSTGDHLQFTTADLQNWMLQGMSLYNPSYSLCSIMLLSCLFVVYSWIRTINEAWINYDDNEFQEISWHRRR
jgi:hypothetical protein